MAWAALKKWFEPFRKTPIDDQILEYKLYIKYNLWFDALTDEEKKKVDQTEKQNRILLLRVAESCRDIFDSCQYRFS